MNESGVFGGQLFGSLFAHAGVAGRVRAGDEAWLQAMLDTEAALARATERAGLAPAGSGAAVTSIARAGFYDAGAIGEAATGIGNPVSALVKAMTALVPPDVAPAIHAGATSQDIIDTAAMLLARAAIDVITADLRAAASACARLAREHVSTVMAARTLLQQAVPTTFGLVAASWLTGIDQAIEQLALFKVNYLFCQYAGAGGTLAATGGNGLLVAGLLASELGLREPVLPWHTNRLPVLSLAAALTATCAALAKPARDVTLLAQTEVAEVAEQTGGGSSAMPHKRNPVASVLVLGCAKQAPGLQATIAAAAEQELQRAAGAWHAEWLPVSQLLQLTGSAAAWGAELLSGLRVDPDAMRGNLARSRGLPMAENVTGLLAPSMGRIAAHELVARASSRAVEQDVDLGDALWSDAESAEALRQAGVSHDELAAALTPESYLGVAADFIARALAAHSLP